ncbi:hypothetical protein AB0392_48890 [Nonomuraea angiospora]|uniref:recombination directionality factor n=1 Tax=Nonomuraea angiospora TaxID=46172 RepID=UPI00344C6FD4
MTAPHGLLDSDGDEFDIKDLQYRQRTLGKIRAGTYDDTGKGRPVRSDTFIITSPYQHFVEAAAAAYGTPVEEWQPQGSGGAQWRTVTDEIALDAILPPMPRSPLSRAYEKWGRGIIQRRCDGITLRHTDTPCVCKAQWGDLWWEKAPDRDRCKITARLNMMLPDIPDTGVWLFETHSFNAAMEIKAQVTLWRRAFGPETPIPFRLFLTWRRKPVKGIMTDFPVPAVELRGVSAGQVAEALLPGAAAAGALETASQRAALGAAPPPDYLAEIGKAASRQELTAIWERARRDPRCTVPGAEFEAAGKARMREINAARAEWDELLSSWKGTLQELEAAFTSDYDIPPQQASAEQLKAFLAGLAAEAPQSPPVQPQPMVPQAPPGEEPVEADLVHEPQQPKPTPEQQRPVGAANRQTLTKLNTLFGEAGISGDARFLWLLNNCQVQVTSTAQLTAAKADEAIGKLDQLADARREDLARRIYDVWGDLGGRDDEMVPAVCLWVNSNTRRRNKPPVTLLDEVSNVHLDAFLKALCADPGKGQITPDDYRQTVAAQGGGA